MGKASVGDRYPPPPPPPGGGGGGGGGGRHSAHILLSMYHGEVKNVGLWSGSSVKMWVSGAATGQPATVQTTHSAWESPQEWTKASQSKS